MKNSTVHLISLGCSKNLVDSEQMLGSLSESGFSVTQDPNEADVIIINTCSFIQDAANESIETILEAAKFKQQGKCRKLIVAGCLPQRYQTDIASSMPEVDVFLGTGAFNRIVEAVKGETEPCLFPDPDSPPSLNHSESSNQGTIPRVHTGVYTAYIKISEGCSKRCTYCIIPKLRGNLISRQTEQIIEEARELISAGFKELILVSQDTTGYGSDLTDSDGLGQLLQRLAALSNDVWIRFLYGHPESIFRLPEHTDKLDIIEVIAQHPNLCSYFDIPIQHADDEILRRMGRNYSRNSLYHLFETIREKVPDASLRTTVIVGFPGETDQSFKNLMSFIQDIRFDHLGVFTYSDSDDLPSHRLSDHVPKRTAKKRLDRLMSLQRNISLEKNQEKIGKIMPVLIEEHPEKDMFVGRTPFQAPEVDGISYIQMSEQLTSNQENNLKAENIIGKVMNVKIIDALEYDLIGVLV